MQKKIYDMIEPQDLTPDMRLIAEVCGIDNARKILRDLGGTSVYIPKITRLHSFVDRYMADNSGKERKDIARELGVSETYLRNRS
jgi:hypothetical protein